jgi:hypothetical protein
MVIASFVGEIFSPLAFNIWLSHLNQKMWGSQITFNNLLVKGFFLLKTNGLGMIYKIIILTP